MTREDWDRLWGVIHKRELAHGLTQGQAIFQADEEMVSKWGNRPEAKETAK